MQNLRLVILDFPKKKLDTPLVKRVFGDLVQAKQLNYERTSDTYISLSPLDMISTHILIYDTTNSFEPRLVMGMRICHEARARQFQLSLPIDDYFNSLPSDGQEEARRFRMTHPNLMDVGALFVDHEFSHKNTGTPMVEMGLFATVAFILRSGGNHLIGATNERYKGSKWVYRASESLEAIDFIHPKVPDPHRLLLVEKFSEDWLLRCWESFGSLIRNAMEVRLDQEGSVALSQTSLSFLGEGSARK